MELIYSFPVDDKGFTDKSFLKPGLNGDTFEIKFSNDWLNSSNLKIENPTDIISRVVKDNNGCSIVILVDKINKELHKCGYKNIKFEIGN